MAEVAEEPPPWARALQDNIAASVRAGVQADIQELRTNLAYVERALERHKSNNSLLFDHCRRVRSQVDMQFPAAPVAFRREADTATILEQLRSLQGQFFNLESRIRRLEDAVLPRY